MRLTVAAVRITSVAWGASQCDTNDAVYKHTRTSACDGCSCWATEFPGVALAGFGEYCALYASSAAGEARTRAMRSFLLDLLGMETLARLRSSLRSTTLRAFLRECWQRQRQRRVRTYSLASMAQRGRREEEGEARSERLGTVAGECGTWGAANGWRERERRRLRPISGPRPSSSRQLQWIPSITSSIQAPTTNTVRPFLVYTIVSSLTVI